MMRNSIFFRFLNIFPCYILMLFLFFLIHFVHCDTLNSNDDPLLQSFRPLKYFNDKNCSKFCKNIICQPIEDCEFGVIKKNETYCGCCEACVKFLGNKENCANIIKGTLALGSQTRCKIGTSCENGKCTLDTEKNTCSLHQDIRKKHNETGKYESEILVPQCDGEGYYTAKQGLSKLICVDKSGNKIFGTADDILKNTCACSRYIQEKIKENPDFFYVQPQEHCSASGSFDTLQCIGNLCYCADKNTGDIKSELVRIDFLQNLECFNSKIHKEDYLKDCEKELQRTRKLAYEFWKKNVRIHGIDKVKCDPDGTFSPVQCLPDRCVCTDEMGSGIKNYFAELKHLYDKTISNMTCNCARDENSEHFPSFSCETYGSYQPATCFVNNCVCVDEYGENIALKNQKELEKGSASDACKNVLRDLLKYPSEEDDTNASDPDYDY